MQMFCLGGLQQSVEENGSHVIYILELADDLLKGPHDNYSIYSTSGIPHQTSLRCGLIQGFPLCVCVCRVKGHVGKEEGELKMRVKRGWEGGEGWGTWEGLKKRGGVGWVHLCVGGGGRQGGAAGGKRKVGRRWGYIRGGAADSSPRPRACLCAPRNYLSTRTDVSACWRAHATLGEEPSLNSTAFTPAPEAGAREDHFNYVRLQKRKEKRKRNSARWFWQTSDTTWARWGSERVARMHLLSASCVCALLITALLRQGKLLSPWAGSRGARARCARAPEPQVHGQSPGNHTQVPPKNFSTAYRPHFRRDVEQWRCWFYVRS